MKHIALSALILLTGCASAGYRAADCVRIRHAKYNVLACDDFAVKEHCRRKAGTDYYPRACITIFSRRFGRKDSIKIGKSYLGCLSHEIGHHENPDKPEAWVAERFPCVGDVEGGHR